MKKKIILISDALLSSSGVGVQSRYLALGLAKTGKYQINQLGAAIKHEDYTVREVTPDIVMKPIDGFGDRNLYRQLLATERPDAVIIFSDPRFFTQLLEVHDEFHQLCPIVWNHLWDQCDMPPMYNKNMYDAVDAFLCINRPTYEFMRGLYGDIRVKWAPHALPREIFFPMSEQERKRCRDLALPGRSDHFVAGWVGRNAHRKRPADVMWGFKMFLDRLKRERGHQRATLMMHTDPHDQEGPNLLHVLDVLKLNDNVVFSREQVGFDGVNALHNVCDVGVSLSKAEGFGLPILEAMYCAKPVIAVKTGGLTRQVVDWRDGSENGVGLEPELKSIVGSQATPYIVEDYARVESYADGLWKIYEMGADARKELGLKAMRYAHEEFGIDRLIETWDATLEDTMKSWRLRRPRWTRTEVR